MKSVKPESSEDYSPCTVKVILAGVGQLLNFLSFFFFLPFTGQTHVLVVAVCLMKWFIIAHIMQMVELIVFKE